MIDTTIETVQRISAELRPRMLDDLGLSAAVEWQLQEFERRTGIKCKLTLSREKLSLDSARSTAVFRILQEALTNVARHANARRVTVTLKEDGDNFMLRVRDYGEGIKQDKIFHPLSLGLLGMRERGMVWGGEIEIEGVSGKGTTVTLRLPLRRKVDRPRRRAAR